MQETWNTFMNDLGPLLLHVLGAIGILIVGYFLAKIISNLIAKALHKTRLDDRAAEFFAGETEKPIEIEPIIKRIIFWLIMIMALVGALQLMTLSFVTEPINAFLEEILGYLPNLLAAALLVVLAFIVSAALRFATRRAMHALGVDQRLNKELEDDRHTTVVSDDPAKKKSTTSVTESVSTAVYYVVWLLFLPAILDTLQLSGLLSPVRNMLTETLNFLPNLLAAVLIGIVGVFLARLLRKIVTSLSAAAGIDNLSERVGMNKVLGSQRLSDTLGTIVYVLVLIPVLIAALNALAIEAITEPASRMLNEVLLAIPLIFAAAIILIIAYVIGKLLAGLVSSLLSSIGFNRMLSNVGLTESENAGADGRSPADIVGALVLVAVMLFAGMEAASLLSFEGLAAIIAEILELGARVLLALVIFGLGLYLARLARDAIRDSGVDNSVVLARVGYWAILVLAGAMALRQIGLADSIINMAFGLLLGAIAVAVAIAYGWGGRDLARKHLEQLDEKASGSSPNDHASSSSPTTRPPKDPLV